MGCLHDPANVLQTSSKCIQNTGANAGRLLDRKTYVVVAAALPGHALTYLSLQPKYQRKPT